MPIDKQDQPETGSFSPFAKIIDQATSIKILQDAYGQYKKISGGKVEILRQQDFEKKWDSIYPQQYSWSNWVVPNHGNLEGFALEGVNYINQNIASVDTLPHEMLHSNEHPEWKKLIASPDGAESQINEGVTEYLTIKAVEAAGYTPSHSYPYQKSIIQVLVKMVGEAVIFKAYFKGETDALKKAVDDKCRGSWVQFKAAMDKKQWIKARLWLVKK